MLYGLYISSIFFSFFIPFIFFSNSVAPQIQASGITLALLGERVDLKCTVKAKPTPKVIFWRDHEGRVPVIIGKNFEMTMEANNEVNEAIRINMFFFCVFSCKLE